MLIKDPFITLLKPSRCSFGKKKQKKPLHRVVAETTLAQTDASVCGQRCRSHRLIPLERSSSGLIPTCLLLHPSSSYLRTCEMSKYFCASEVSAYFIKCASPKDFGQLAIPQCLSGDSDIIESTRTLQKFTSVSQSWLLSFRHHSKCGG